MGATRGRGARGAQGLEEIAVRSRDREACEAVGFRQTHVIWRQEAWASEVT